MDKDKMKKCPHCGTIQSASRQTCVDCGRVLPEADEVFADELDMMASGSIDGKYNHPFPRWARLLGISMLGLIVLNIVLIYRWNFDDRGIGLAVSCVFAGLSALIAIFPYPAAHILRPSWRYRHSIDYDPDDLDVYADSDTHLWLTTWLVVFALTAIGFALFSIFYI
ncbi:MAG: hypothetical protein IJ493_13140 [Clostridia bacterium]|nr:hypothetical protein [Clostridia bacterium]